MLQDGGETYEDLMIASDLRSLLRTQTANELRRRWEQNNPRPPVTGVLIFGATGLVCLAMQPDVAYVFLAIAGMLLAWYIVSAAIRAANDLPHKLELIEGGNFPPECMDLLVPRLSWWNQVLEPHRWARHSRIYDVAKRLKKRADALEQEIRKLEPPTPAAPGAAASAATPSAPGTEPETSGQEEEPSTEALMAHFLADEHAGDDTPADEPAPADGIYPTPAEVNKHIRTLTQRMRYQDLIAKLEPPLRRKQADLVLTQAMLQRAEETTRILERIKTLRVDLAMMPRGALGPFVEKTLVTLEERRHLVGIIDQVDPAARINLVSL